MIDLEQLVDDIMTPWILGLGDWEPSGRGVDGVCETCVGSPFASMAGLAAWPHQVTHPVVRSLVEIARRLELEYIDTATVGLESLSDRRHRLFVYERHAQTRVEREFSRYLADVSAELEFRLAPVLARYLDDETERAVEDIGRQLVVPGEREEGGVA